MRLSIIILDSTAWICKALKNLAIDDVWLKARKIEDSEHGEIMVASYVWL